MISKHIIGWFVVAAGLGLLPLTTEARTDGIEDFQISSHTRIVTDESAEQLDITHELTVRNRTDRALRSLDLALPVTNTGGVVVEYSNGDSITFATATKLSTVAGIDFEHKSLILDFPKDLGGRDEVWRFKVSYTTPNGIYSLGDNVTIALPLLDGGVADSWRVTATVPATFPDINYRPSVESISTTSQGRRYEFSSRSVGRNFLGLSFADTLVNSLDITTELHNRAFFLKTVQINLPLDTHSQSVFIDSIDPSPSDIKVDRDGNVIASYRLWPRQRLHVRVSATILSGQLRYDAKDASEFPPDTEGQSDFLASGDYWPLDRVDERAQEVLDSPSTVWGATRQLHDSVAGHVALEKDHSERLPADEVLENNAGSALNIADAVVALLRSQDIPARIVEGVVYPSSGLYNDTHYHAWAEAYVDGVGWVTLDPAWARLFGGFGYSSFDRVATRIVSDDEQKGNFQPFGAMAFSLNPEGELKSQEPEELRNQVAIDAYRYMILPGVVYNQRTVSNRGGQVVDEVRADDLFDGSLAPRAEITRGQWALAWFGKFDMSLDVGEEPLAEINSEPVWWPLIAVGIILLLGGVLQFYRYKSRRYLNRRLHGNALH